MYTRKNLRPEERVPGKGASLINRQSIDPVNSKSTIIKYLVDKRNEKNDKPILTKEQFKNLNLTLEELQKKFLNTNRKNTDERKKLEKQINELSAHIKDNKQIYDSDNIDYWFRKQTLKQKAGRINKHKRTRRKHSHRKHSRRKYPHRKYPRRKHSRHKYPRHKHIRRNHTRHKKNKK